MQDNKAAYATLTVALYRAQLKTEKVNVMDKSSWTQEKNRSNRLDGRLQLKSRAQLLSMTLTFSVFS